MQGTLIWGIIFALLVAVFSIQNAGPVSLVFFTWRFETSLVVVVLGGIALGAIIMGLFSSFKQFKLKRKLKKLKFEKENLEVEKKELETNISKLEEEEKVKEENSGKKVENNEANKI